MVEGCRRELLGHDLHHGHSRSSHSWANSISITRLESPFWLGRVLLAWRLADGILPPHAVLREQPLTSQSWVAGRRGFKPEHLVAWSTSSDSVGRELARKPSCLPSISALQSALVAGRYW